MIARKKKAGVRAITDPEKKKSSVKLGFKRGKETRVYSPERVLTGDPSYGKENTNAPDPKFIQDARKSKQDVVFKDGKSYRAGRTIITKEPDRFSADVEIDKTIPKLKSATRLMPSTSEKKIKPGLTGNKTPMKRRLKRVSYLQGKGYGRNPRTEAGYGK